MKWTTMEEEALVRAYVQVSQDPIHGAEQKALQFWAKIQEKWIAATSDNSSNAKTGSTKDTRTSQALRNRWHTISHDVSKFVGCVSLVEARHESGKSPEDLITDARVVFNEQQGSEFAHYGCWEILRKVPKFISSISSPSKSCESESHVASGNCGVAGGETSRDAGRPGGRKRAKIEEKDQSDDSKLIEQLVNDAKSRGIALVAEIQRKNDLLEEQMNFQYFRMNPDSEESKTYFALQRRKRLATLMKDAEQECIIPISQTRQMHVGEPITSDIQYIQPPVETVSPLPMIFGDISGSQPAFVELAPLDSERSSDTHNYEESAPFGRDIHALLNP